LVEDQVSVVEPPGAIEVGEADKVAVGPKTADVGVTLIAISWDVVTAPADRLRTVAMAADRRTLPIIEFPILDVIGDKDRVYRFWRAHDQAD
jgi:hypothetical protein